MLILEKQILRLIEQETDKVLQELSQKQVEKIRNIFTGVGKSADEADKVFDITKTLSLGSIPDEALKGMLTDAVSDLGDEGIEAIIKAVRGVDDDIANVAPMTRGPDADLAADVASDAAEEGIAARKVIDLGDGELIEPGEAFKRVSGVDLKPEQTRQVLAIVKRSDNLPAVVVADNLAKAIDLPEFNTKRALAALAALGVVGTSGKIAWDNFGIAAAGEDDVSVGKPAPSPGGVPPASLSPTVSTGDAGWDKYLRGSEYVTPDQAKQVYDAWIKYVKSKEANLQEEISEDASFANFVQWWKDNKGYGNLGRWGSWDDTIKYLKSQTKKPEDPVSAVDKETEVEPAAPAAPATKAADGGPVTPLYNSYQGFLASMEQAKIMVAKDDGTREFNKKQLFKDYPALKGYFPPGQGGMSDTASKAEVESAIDRALGTEKKKYDRLRAKEINQMKRKAKRIPESIINESVYNRWQKIIKG